MNIKMTSRTFVLNCYTDTFYPNPTVLKGDNIIVPTKILEEIQELEDNNVFIFSVTNTSNNNVSSISCKAVEFSHDPSLSGNVYIPQWMQQTLLLNLGDCVNVSLLTQQLEKGTKITVQPQDSLFLILDNHKEILEKSLKDFNTLTSNTSIIISYDDEDYGIQITDVEPNNGSISIIDTDLEVDFLPPIDYIEFKPSDWPEDESWPLPHGVFIQEERLTDPKQYILSNEKIVTVKPIIKNIVLPSASLIETTNDVPNTESNKPFVPFSGKGYRLGS